MSLLPDDMSEKARLILQALYSHEGVADMSAVKGHTGIEESSTIKYHSTEHLEASDLVESELVDDGTPQGIREFELTDKGWRAAAALIESEESRTVVDRLDEIEKFLRETNDRMDVFEGRVDDVDERMERVASQSKSAKIGDLEENLRKRIDSVRRDVKEIEKRRRSRLDQLEEEIERVADSVAEESEEEKATDGGKQPSVPNAVRAVPAVQKGAGEIDVDKALSMPFEELTAKMGDKAAERVRQWRAWHRENGRLSQTA